MDAAQPHTEAYSAEEQRLKRIWYHPPCGTAELGSLPCNSRSYKDVMAEQAGGLLPSPDLTSNFGGRYRYNIHNIRTHTHPWPESTPHAIHLP